MRNSRLLTAVLSASASVAWAQPIFDHLHCFKIKDSAAKATYTADLTPGDIAAPVATGCQIKVPAKIMCIDVDAGNVTPPPPGAAAGTSARSYLCYKVKCPKAERVVAGTDQFGSHSITVKASNLVCAPLEATTSSTTTTSTSTSTTTTIVIPFRLTSLELRDPHLFATIIIGCTDITDSGFPGFSFNGAIATAIGTDSDSDGNLDASWLAVFTPFDETVSAGGTIAFAAATCSAPLAGTSCSVDGAMTSFAYLNGSESPCLTSEAGTVRPYTPPVTSAVTPCFAGGPADLTLSLVGIPVTLHDAEIAATYVGNPATSLVSGLLRGFVTESDANATVIPFSFPVIGGKALSEILPGGDPPGANNQSCTATSDKDVRDGVPGWWFYLNFTAAPVDYTP